MIVRGPLVLAALALIGCGGEAASAGSADAAGVGQDGDATAEAAAPDSAGAADSASDAPDAPDAPDASEAAVAPPDKMLSLNLHCLKTEGTTFATNTARFAAIAARVAAEGVTFIALQEACRRTGESAMESLGKELERATGVAWSSQWAFAHKAWAGTADEADEGLGLFARAPLTAPDVITLRVQSGLTRIALSAALPSGLRVYSVHFDYVSGSARASQARELAAAALVDTDPGFGAIVAGDFNAPAGAEAHAIFGAFGYRDLSGKLDPTRIDHVFVHRAAGLSASAARLVFDGADGPIVSDHPGVLVTLAAAPKESPTITRVAGRATLSAGQWLSLRGAAAPLDWLMGVPLRETKGGFRVVLTEPAGPKFEAKLLRDDVVWMKGSNAVLTVGADQTIDATF